MGKMNFSINSKLLEAVGKLAVMDGIGKADVIRNAIVNQNYFKQKIAEGKEVWIFDPVTNTTTIVDMK